MLHACILEYTSTLHTNSRYNTSRIEVSLLVALFSGFYLMFVLTEAEEQHKKGGRSGLICHVSGHRVNVEADIQICTHKLQSEFLITIQDK